MRSNLYRLLIKYLSKILFSEKAQRIPDSYNSLTLPRMVTKSPNIFNTQYQKSADTGLLDI